MEAPINMFEFVESIRFFGAVVSTPEVDEESKKIANKYISRMLAAMEKSVTEQIAKINGIIV